VTLGVIHAYRSGKIARE